MREEGKLALIITILLCVFLVSGSAHSLEPAWTDYWEGRAELQQDAGQIGSTFAFHFPSVLYEGNEIWAYYIKSYQSDGVTRFATGRARSTNGINWTDDGIVLDIGGAWQWTFQSKGSGIGHQIGRIDGDGWSANVAQDGPGYLCYGPYTTTIPGGPNCASFKLMCDSSTGTDKVVTIDVYDATAGVVLVTKDITRNNFSAPMTYQVFNLNFTSTAGNQLEFRTYWYKKSYIKQELVAISQGNYPFWDNVMVSFPGVWKDGSTYYLVYEGSGPSGNPGDIGLATSTDGRNWVKHPNNPILRHNKTGWEKTNIGTPSLYKEGNTWYLFYHGFDGTDCRIGVATGTNLASLTKYSGNPIINTVNGAWDAGTAGRRSAIRKEGSYYYLAYEGSTDQPYPSAKWSSGLARSTNLLSWTKYPSNPVIPQTASGFGNDGPEIMQIGDINYLYVRSSNPATGPTVRYRLSWKPELFPAAPSNANATNYTANSLRWTWVDNSSNETGFKVFSDPGTGPPTTLRATTSANATHWDYTGLTGNTRYCFQVAATNNYADSAKTLTITKFTLASPPSVTNNVNCNMATGTWHPVGTTFVFSNPAGFGVGTHGGNQYRASKFTYAWNKNPTHNFSGAESTWNSGSLTLSPNAGDGSYYLHLRSWNSSTMSNPTTLDYGPFRFDATSPTGSIVINGGAAYTTSRNVTLTLSVTDASSGIAQMRFSNDGVTWTVFENFAASKQWELTPSDGPKQVFVQYKDTAGNISDSFNSGIVLDTQFPITSAVPDGGVYSGSKIVTLQASEPAAIYYTTDGSNPTTGSSVYTAPIQIASNTILRFFAVDTAGNTETPVKQEAYTIITNDGSILDAKGQADATDIALGNKVLYLKWDNFGYIEEQSRTQGIKVVGNFSASEDHLVCLTGVMRTTPHGERYIDLIELTPADPFLLGPYGANNRDVQSGLLTGIFTKVWGAVKEGSITGNSFVISDGFNDAGLKILTKDAPGVQSGDFVTISGAAGFEGQRVIYKK